MGVFAKGQAAEVTGISSKGCEVVAMSSSRAHTLSISDLSGLDVTRTRTLAQMDGSVVAPVFYLPVPNYESVSARLQQLKREDADAVKAAPVQREEMEQRGRLLDGETHVLCEVLCVILHHFTVFCLLLLLCS